MFPYLTKIFVLQKKNENFDLNIGRTRLKFTKNKNIENLLLNSYKGFFNDQNHDPILTKHHMKLIQFIRQSLNVPGLIQTLKLFKNPNLFVPHARYNSVNDINIKELKNIGINCIVFDKDNTLSLTYDENIHQKINLKLIEFINEFPLRVAILSNSVGSCDDENYLEAVKIENKFKIPVIRHVQKKPNCLGEVLIHFKSRLNRDIHPTEICVIGL
jgi:hypothetical protein